MTQAVALAQQASTGVSQGFKNRIINGAMVIDQRNAGASVTPADGAYTLDRWIYEASQASKFSIQQNAGAVTPPVGFSNYLGMTVVSAVSVGAGDYFAIGQRIEGFNIADLGWGTANAKTVTLSFQVRSSLTGTFGGSISNGAANRAYPFTYTISSANTWTSISITIAGDTTGTWPTNNTNALRLWLGLGVGSTYNGTAGAWAAGTYISATGATSVVGTNGATFYLTGVQLEVGSTATSFDYRPYGTELALCKRYYHYVGGTANGFPLIQMYAGSTNQPTAPICFPSQMRATPTMTVVGTWGGTNNIGNPSFIYMSPDGASMILTASSTGMVEAWPNTTDDRANFSAEL